MNTKFQRMSVQTKKAEEAVDITAEVEQKVRESGIKEGLVNVFIEHTSAGLAVMEGIWDLEEDVFTFLGNLVSVSDNFRHNRYLEEDGRLAVNPAAHLKSLTSGYHMSFPIHEGEIVKGSRQTIYFLEFDGPLLRYYNIQIIGETTS